MTFIEITNYYMNKAFENVKHCEHEYTQTVDDVWFAHVNDMCMEEMYCMYEAAGGTETWSEWKDWFWVTYGSDWYWGGPTYFEQCTKCGDIKNIARWETYSNENGIEILAK